LTAPIRIGVLRLVDSAPVVVAAARGLFANLDIEARISVEPSWANIADKLAYGLMDAAVMLPPLVLAAAIGLRGSPAPVAVPMGLTQGGNSIVFGVDTGLNRGASAPHLLDWLRAQPCPPRLAVVHRYSTHNLLLRYWLARAGADPDRDVQTVVVPPAAVVSELAERRIAGFCAGAPWGEVAEQRGAGRIVAGTSSVWPSHPEKCLAVNTHWADMAPDALHRLIQALLRAQRLCDDPVEADAVAAMLVDPAWLSLPNGPTRMALPGGSGVERVRFHAGEVWYPAHAHALWFLGQMRRWGWLPDALDLAAVARAVYRPDLLARPVEQEGLYAAKCVLRLEGSAMLPAPDDSAFSPA
jgi:NitT/TauT family transport system ATP-binding protein/nitrate/nitrite transport system substrate-binding protein